MRCYVTRAIASCELEPAQLATEGVNATYGFILALTGDVAGARQVFTKSRGKSSAMRSFALLDLMEGKYRDGRGKLQEAVVLNVAGKETLSEARNHLYLSTVLAAQGDRAAAARELDLAIARLDAVPPVAWLRSHIGTASARMGAVDRATRMLEKLRKEMNPNDPADSSSLHLLSGEIALAQGNPAKAVEWIRLADREDRRLLTVETLARATEAAGSTDEDISLYEQVLQDPHRIGSEGQQRWLEAHVRLASLYARHGDRAKAHTTLDRLLTLWRAGDQDLPLLREARALDEQVKMADVRPRPAARS